MSSRISSPSNLVTCGSSKRDSQGSAGDRREGKRLKQHNNLQGSEGEVDIRRANNDGSGCAISSSSGNSSGGYRSTPHPHHHHHHPPGSGDAEILPSASTTSSTGSVSLELAHGDCADAAVTDQNMSDFFGGVPVRCGGSTAQHIQVGPSSTSRGPPWEFSSTYSSLTDSSSVDHFFSPSGMDYCCTSASATEPSHRCDLNYSHQDRLHPHLHQQQVELSTGPTAPQVGAPLRVSRDTPELLPRNEDHQSGISVQQQGITSSPAAAIADQDLLHFASTIPNSWHNSPPPVLSSASSFSSTQSSNLSSETEFGGGGAPITPGGFNDTLRNNHLSSSAHSKNKSTETPNIYEGGDEEDSDGGIAVDHYNTEMSSSGPVQLLYSSSALHATIMDEDEDDFSPNDLVTRPSSPVGSSSFFMDILSSPRERLPENTNGELPSPYMRLDTRRGGFDPISNVADVPSTELFDSRSQSSAAPSTLVETPIDSSPPNSQPLVSLGTDGPEIIGEGDELFIESNYINITNSMPSQSSPQSPPTAASVVIAVPPVAAVAAAPGIMAATAGVEEVTPSTAHASLPTLPPPRPLLPPPLPPYAERTPSVFPPFDVFTFDGGSISEDDEFDDITNHPFEQMLPLEDLENYNCDFSKFCERAYYKYSMNTPGFPKVSGAALDVKRLERPLEITRADMIENGWDYQAIPWDKLWIDSHVARGLRRQGYDNYRNIKTVDDENHPILPANRNFFTFRRMDTQQRCRVIHFQLRNLLGVVSRNDVFYAGDAQVLHTNPLTGNTRPIMDLRSPDSWSGNPIRISTLGACAGSNGVVMAGCFHGEYAMKPIHADANSAPITGIVTKNDSGITNHVQMTKNRTTGTPNAVFSSNDFFIRVLSCGEDMQLLSEHEYAWRVNCSATSPDSRLRVVVGDDTDVLVCDAERGTTEFVLKGHRDFGFAAAWSDDGYTLATGNQDKTVRIFDARNFSKAVKVLPAVMSGVRTLRFSPIGNGGKRVLAMAEPGDVVQIVDAVSWDSLQQIDFWGEVGGIDFDPSGEEFFIVNADKCVGGVMEFSRSKGSAYYENYGYENAQQRHRAEKDVWRRRRKRTAFMASSDDDSESTAFSDEDLAIIEVDEDVQHDPRKRGKYYDSRRYKRLGHDMSSVFV